MAVCFFFAIIYHITSLTIDLSVCMGYHIIILKSEIIFFSY